MSQPSRPLRFAVGEGERIYAIGDVHGCLSALDQLMGAIRRDALGRAPALTRLVLLGDVIDRGPDSAGVLRSVMRYSQASDRFTVLMGNHEQLMGRALGGDQEALALWLGVGGAETLESFGVDPALVRQGASDTLLSATQKLVGADVVAWLLDMPLSYRSGGVVFVHAGVRPGVAFDKQDPKDLLWIRDAFINDVQPRDFLVIHGHTVFPEGVDWGEFRIGVDTGAYQTGMLTALGLEGSSAWTISSGD